MERARDAQGRFVAASASSETFLGELQASWALHGAATIETVRVNRPHDYLRLMASSLTKLSDGPANTIEAMTDDEIADELRRILDRLDAQGADAGARTGEAGAA